MAKGILPGIPHVSKAVTAPKPGMSDTQNIEGFGVRSKFFTPKNPVVPKSGAKNLDLGQFKQKPSQAGLGKRAFPPPLKGLP